MKIRATLVILGIAGILTLAALTVQAAGPIATPEGLLKGERGEIPALTDKAFGDPTDFRASALAGADYIRYMQADIAISEDNAGNGDPDQDLEDAGWDWVLTPFVHSGSASPPNLYGVCANAAYQGYLIEADPTLFITMKDAADYIVAAGPGSIRSAADMVFLLDFATLPEVINPLTYQNGAAAIWAYRLANYGGTATAFAQALSNSRGAGGAWANGIIPWDLAPYVTSLMRLEALFPGNNYASDAAEIVEVLYQDGYNGNPGYFEPHVATTKGFDPTYANTKFYLYPAGVAGLIIAFEATGLHALEIPALEAVLLECQYADGAFSYQYGADTSVDDRDWQTTAYSVFALWDNMAHTPANLAAVYGAAAWLAATQDVSGGWVYGSGNHYPEVGAEAAAAVAYGYFSAGAALNVTASGADPAQCGVTKTATFSFDRSEGTLGLFGYEVVLQITGPVTPLTAVSFVELFDMDYFQTVDNGSGQFTVNGTLFGADPGILTDEDLFKVDLVTSGNGTVNIDILSYRFRDPVNTFIFADMNGLSFVVDCTAPGPVADITAGPRHNKVDVTWTHDGLDTAVYKVYRGLWHNGTVNVSAYPEYDDVAPPTPSVRPASAAAADADPEWVLAGTVNVGTLSFTDAWPDASSRGVYYYEVFAVDAAGNGSAAAAANDRSLNYWLGDVPPYIDGLVDVDDITVLGSCFATIHGGGFYNNMCDVGRTDDWSRLGIPLTDNIIDFEDLMVFSMNYNVVGPAKALPMSRTIDFAWVQKDDGRWALHLVGGTGLKGVRVRADLPVTVVTAGDLLASQPEMTFLVNAGKSLDVNLALMGRDLGFEGTGELFVLESGAAISPEDLTIEVRGTDNSKLDYTLDKVGGTVTPKAFSLGANYPNPFNPMTKIKFSLPEARDVVMAVYSLDGRRVATLLNEPRGAGDHEVVWMGRDDAGQLVASGTYFYRIDAGPYSQVKKMTLMK